MSAGMSDVLAFQCRGDRLVVEATPFAAVVLGPKMDVARRGSPPLQVIAPDDLSDAAAFTAQLAVRASEFAFANLQICIAMNYQAAVLHHAQLAPASFAINFSVAEALINEVIYSYGGVIGVERRAFGAKHHTIAPMSRKAMRTSNLETKVRILQEGELIGSLSGATPASRARHPKQSDAFGYTGVVLRVRQLANHGAGPLDASS